MDTQTRDEVLQLPGTLTDCTIDLTEQFPSLSLVDEKATTTELLDLPFEIRDKIWQYFKKSEIKILRQVCSTIKSDIDCMRSVDGILDGTDDNFEWIKQANLQSLTVQSLQMPLSDPFLRLPNFLKKLVIIQGYVPILDIYFMLSNFTNLTELSLSVSAWKPSALARKVLYSNDISEVLKCVERNWNLETLNFTLAAATTAEQQQPVMGEKVVLELVTYAARLKHLHVNFPDVWHNFGQLLCHWRAFLLQQDQLETFSSNMGFMSLEYYAPTLVKCQMTLTKIAFYDIQCTYRGTREVFNWGLFSGFLNLTSFKLLAKQRWAGQGQADHLETINFSDFPLRSLTELSLSYVYLRDDVIFQIFDRGMQLQILNLQFFGNPHRFMFNHVRRVLGSRRFAKITICDRRPLFFAQRLSQYVIHEVCRRYLYTSHWTPQYQIQYDYLQVCKNVHPVASG